MDDMMMTLLLSEADWVMWKGKLAEFWLSRLSAPERYPVVAALIVSSWGMQELETRYMYVDHIMTDCEAYASQEMHRKAMSKRYKKRPVIIEAFQLTNEQRLAGGPFPDWALAALGMETTEPVRNSERIFVNTLEGKMYANAGDYIIRGIKGEVYPCKADIFEATYDLVEEAQP